jgi:hypothetical protein
VYFLPKANNLNLSYIVTVYKQLLNTVVFAIALSGCASETSDHREPISIDDGVDIEPILRDGSTLDAREDLVVDSGAKESSGVTIEQFADESRSAVAAGSFVKIYDPSESSTKWYINDHTVIKGPDGKWHLFGITHAEPSNPSDERNFAHATASSIHGPWTKQPFDLTYDPNYGETYLWAPYVLLYNGVFYMFYAGGGTDSRSTAINLATSSDLFTWKRHTGGTLFRDGYDARDPMVLRIGNQWVMYYCGTTDPAGGQHAVLYRTSTDLIRWSERNIAFEDPYSPGTSGGPTESSFVVARDGAYYLFIGPRYSYSDTDVFRSTDPLRFDTSQFVGRIPAHAVEVVQDDADSSWWVTHAGWNQGGVFLAPLKWTGTFSGARVKAPSYRAQVITNPNAALTSFQVLVDNSWRELLTNAFRGTRPYVAVGNGGPTDSDSAGTPASVSVTENGQVLLSGIPIGNEPINLDWKLQFNADSFDMSLTWHVAGNLSASAWEVGWTANTVLPMVGDSAATNRNGYVAGFARWTLASDGNVSLVSAYKNGSSWSTTNNWFSGDAGTFTWQSFLSSGGKTWSSGDYQGGTWRLGVSPVGSDSAFANRLYSDLSQ